MNVSIPPLRVAGSGVPLIQQDTKCNNYEKRAKNYTFSVV